MIVVCHFVMLQRNWITIIHQLMFFSKIIRKLKIIIKKKVMAAREKPLCVKTQKLFEQQSACALPHHNNSDKLKLNV